MSPRKIRKALVGFVLLACAQAQAEIAVPMVQLPYRNPQPLRHLIEQNDRLFSLQHTLRAIDKYVPSEYALIVHGRSWPSHLGACRDVHQDALHCKAALRFLVDLMEQKAKLGLTRMRTISFDGIPYRDPAPLETALRGLDWTNGTPTMSHEQAKALLAPYLDMSLVVDAPAGSQFNYARTMCVYDDYVAAPYAAPYYVHCHQYASDLLAIMREREATMRRVLINPFGR